MIRLGSLAGYPFEGPRVLAGWIPPARPAVFAILIKPDRDERYAVIDVDHADDLSTARLPFNHPRSSCWVRRAGQRTKVYICTYEAPGALPSHREQITRELIATYRPGCHPARYDTEWKAEWIGSYTAPTTGPLTTDRHPSPGTRDP